MPKDALNPDELLDELNVAGHEGPDENLVLDLSDVSEELPAFELIPAGIYSATIENVEHVKSKSSGNPMLSWTFSITTSSHAGRLLFYHTVLNKDSGLTRLRKLLTRCFPEIELTKFAPGRFADSGEALGIPCRLKVRITTQRPRPGTQDKAKKQNSITDVLAPGDSTGSFLDDEV